MTIKHQSNIDNAQHSTGPRTPEGKAASSRNATKHGLTAARPHVAEHERHEFETMCQEFRHSINPLGAVEESLFDQLITASWNIRRIPRLQDQLTADPEIDPLTDDTIAKSYDRFNRYYIQAQGAQARAIRLLRQLQTDRTIANQMGDVPTGHAGLADLSRTYTVAAKVATAKAVFRRAETTNNKARSNQNESKPNSSAPDASKWQPWYAKVA